MIKKVLKHKKLIISFFALCVAFIVLIGELYAWFFVGNLARSESMTIGTINLEEKSSTDIDVSIIGGHTSQAGNYLLMPGESINIAFNVANNSDEDKSFKLLLNEFSQSYGVSLSSPMLDYDLYQIVNGNEVAFDINKKEEESEGFKQNFYAAFKTPITLALKYRLYAENNISDDFYYFSNNVLDNEIVNSSLGIFNIDKNTNQNMILEVNFDAFYYPTINFESSKYILKNSNAFMNQNFSMNLGVNNI